ncbi:MAG TPA: protein kinase [Gemmataceae bacterium]
MSDPLPLEAIFFAALEKGSSHERAAYLDQLSGDNPDLRRRIEKMLAAHAQAGSFLEHPAPSAVATVDDPISERPGTVIGAYELMEQIGEGGMGLVFVAEQQQPVRRKVALKVIKPGMDTRQVVARFEAERQALALMDHPNIAKVLDGGQTSSGLPYFVMELFKGVPITEYCDQNQIPIRERLELFVHVCQAVQHAHQKGIIHRDLKPSNVLVVSHDGERVVKVIDFGVAKAIGQQLTDKTIYTQLTQLVGTPLYMSPEQAGQRGLDVDTRSDIYSLGVLLYELLTGTTPFDKERLRAADYEEMLRIIREEEPPRRSTRLSTLGQAATTVSTNRRSDAKQLRRLFRCELDWIVMKALEKDRDRRYETASAFAADVQRYLQDEPVQACPPSAWYRLGKFTRRNKIRLVLAACAVTLVFGLASSAVWLAVRLRETEWGVTAALTQAKALLKVGDKQTDYPERWQATTRLALAAVEKAEGLLAAGVATEELAAQVRQVRAAVDAAGRDSRLLMALERIRLAQAVVNVKESRFDNGRAHPFYANALKEYGVGLATPEAAAARVRESRLREALLSALADWERVSQDGGERQRVAEVYKLALPRDSLQERLRAAIRRRDLREVSKLAQAPDLPLVSLAINAKALAGMKEWAAAELLLRAGLERNPGDFWLNHELGRLLQDQQPPRAEEAVRYLTAALALRPNSPGVRLNLGLALHYKGDVKGAIRCYRAALLISPKDTNAHLSQSDTYRMDEAIAERRVAIQSLRGTNRMNHGLHG